MDVHWRRRLFSKNLGSQANINYLYTMLIAYYKNISNGDDNLS